MWPRRSRWADHALLHEPAGAPLAARRPPGRRRPRRAGARPLRHPPLQPVRGPGAGAHGLQRLRRPGRGPLERLRRGALRRLGLRDAAEPVLRGHHLRGGAGVLEPEAPARLLAARPLLLAVRPDALRAAPARRALRHRRGRRRHGDRPPLARPAGEPADRVDLRHRLRLPVQPRRAQRRPRRPPDPPPADRGARGVAPRPPSPGSTRWGAAPGAGSGPSPACSPSSPSSPRWPPGPPRATTPTARPISSRGWSART